MRDIENNRYTKSPLSSPYPSGRIRLHCSPDGSPSGNPSPTTRQRKRQSKSGNPLAPWRLAASIFPMAIMTCLALVVVMYLEVESLNNASRIRIPFRVARISKPTTILFGHYDPPTLPMSLSLPPLQTLKDDEESDYGHLKIEFFQVDDVARRQIYRDYSLDKSEYRLPYEDTDDDVSADLSTYYAFDDDAIKGGQTETNEPCRRISEHRLNFQNCNNFHEQHLVEEGIKFLGEGAFREVFGLEHSFEEDLEQFVLKELRFDEDVEVDTSEFIRMDATVAERLSASPRVFDIYGFCGVGILSEYFFHGDIEEVVYEDEGEVSEDLREIEELVVQNNLSGREKLILALEMAEGVALLHGFSGGVIVHDDIQLSQFLLNKDKTMLKINDFNRAEFMLYDDSKQVYCKYFNGAGNGNWRSPEEYKDEPLNEKIDVWSLGNNMYTLLTGLDPFPWLNSENMQAVAESFEESEYGARETPVEINDSDRRDYPSFSMPSYIDEASNE
ncbi:MAG: hypothetical protein SGBAC_008829 [Bacillariaceae sp.]